MTIQEFRKITGFASDDMNDSLVLDVISRLEALADIYINQTNETINKDEF